ncbi:MAG: YfiR family protein [Bacteroidales bacterium]
MKKIQFFLTLLLLMPLFNGIFAQDVKFQALMIYNFTKLIDWPNKSGNFVIKVVGNPELAKELKEFTVDRKAGGKQDFDIQKAEMVNIDNCNILFIGIAESGNLEQILNKLGTNPTLIVTEKSDLVVKGAGVSFVKTEGSWKFQYSEENIKKKGLKISLDFKELGIAK